MSGMGTAGTLPPDPRRGGAAGVRLACRALAGRSLGLSRSKRCYRDRGAGAADRRRAQKDKMPRIRAGLVRVIGCRRRVLVGVQGLARQHRLLNRQIPRLSPQATFLPTPSRKAVAVGVTDARRRSAAGAD